MSQLAIFLFGSPRVELKGEPVDIDRRKALAMLAYLAVTGRAHSRDRLAALLWPEYDQSRARGALRRTLSALNRALAGEWVDADRERVDLPRRDQIWLDVAQFRHLLAACDRHEHPADQVCPACRPLLAEAVALYRDDFLAGFSLRDSLEFDEWQFFQAEGLRRELGIALDRLIRGCVAQNEPEPALDYARRRLRLDPLHEPAHRRLMALYAQTGRRAAALRQYEECERILAEELGLAPAAETTALAARIRAGEGRQGEGQGERKPDPSPRPALPSPESPFLAAAIEPAKPVTPFVAREQELAQLHGYLEKALAGQGQVVFITGEAGSGKTALVYEFARQAQAASANLVVAVGNCNAHTGLGDPYLPFREILGLLTGDVESRWLGGTMSRENGIRLWRLFPEAGHLLVGLAPDLIDTFLPASALRTRATQLAPDQARWLGQVEQLTEARTAADGGNPVAQTDLFDQFARLVHSLGAETPLFLVIDDAQWADTASINLLFHLGRHLPGSRILLAVTYRPDEVALGRPAAGSGAYAAAGSRPGERHPLAPVINELKRTYGQTQIDLSRAPGRAFIDAFLDARPNRLGETFREALYRQTQGHPLFTVELLRAMQARGDIIRDEQGRWVEGATLNWHALPARVEAVIEERIGRLEEGLRELLTIASVEGELFTAQVVAQVQQRRERPLLQSLSGVLARRHQLVQEQEEVQINGRFLSQYRFAHTLFQQYLYDSLSAGERRLLHGEVAAALETIYAGHIDDVTVQLARHYAESGQTDKSVDYLLQAGDRARSLYAQREAVDFYRQALALLKEQGAYDRAARTLMKLGLAYHLAFDFGQARRAYAEGFTLWQLAATNQPNFLAPAPHALRLFGSEPTSLDPALAADSGSGRVIDHLFCGLVEQSLEMEVVPSLAHSWEVVAGGYEYIFHLREDMRWSDGAPVTAHDFAYAWRRVLNPATGSPVANLLYDLKGARAFHRGEVSDPDRVGVQALDEVTLRVELEGPTGYFPQLLAHTIAYPVPRHMVETFDEAWTEPEHLVTNGPFHLARWSPGLSISLVRNPDYRGRATGNVQQVELYFRQDSSTELSMYEAGELDVSAMWFLSGPEVDRIRQRYANDYLAGPTLNTHYLGFDVSRPPFDDARVRRALALAIDKETLADVILGGYAFPATGGFIPPGMPGHSPGIGLPYNPDQARLLLAEAGYPGGHHFPAIEWLAMSGTEPVLNYFQDQWFKNLGIKLAWQEGNKVSYFDTLYKTPPHLARLGWKADYPDPDNFLRAGSFRQQTRWWDQPFDRLVEQARRVTDQAERMKLYHQADKLLMEEAPIIPYLYARRHLLVKPWVIRYPTSPLKSTFWKDVVIEPH